MILGKEEFKYSDEIVEEFVEKALTDKYAVGKKIRGAFPDEIADAIEHLVYVQGFNDIVINIKKPTFDDTLEFEIKSRA